MTIHVIKGTTVDRYQDKVEQVYVDTPAEWRLAIGNDLWYQFGVFDQAPDPHEVSLDQAGRRYLDLQFELAASLGEDAMQPVHRAIDIGCGWGPALKGMAEIFPNCGRIDGINISSRQLECARELVAQDGLANRVQLFLCNAKDIASLPDPDVPFDLALLRGSLIHFSPEVLQETLAALASRMRIGGRIVISENLYKVDLASYEPLIPDPNDRAACGHRKTPEGVRAALERNGFSVIDLRVLPTNADVIHWFDRVKRNLEVHDLPARSVNFKELYDVAVSFSDSLRKDKVSVFSLIGRLERRP